MNNKTTTKGSSSKRFVKRGTIKQKIYIKKPIKVKTVNKNQRKKVYDFLAL